jgi:beta-lactamase class D
MKSLALSFARHSTVAFLLFSIHEGLSWGSLDFRAEFGERDACLLITDMTSGKEVVEYNKIRCNEQLSPCSSFKIAAALMAFEKGILNDENHLIKWDGRIRDRNEINRDLTPYTWMSTSAMWVTQWMTPKLGEETVTSFLEDFSYGNKDFSGGIIQAWQTSSLKFQHTSS